MVLVVLVVLVLVVLVLVVINGMKWNVKEVLDLHQSINTSINQNYKCMI